MEILGYMRQLEISRKEYQKQKEAIRAERNRPLTQKISEWWEALPPELRNDRYTMTWLTNHFCVGGAKIGPALIALGWKRGRSWKADGSYYRYWMPPKS
jgi:hypothetical protein